MGFLKTFAATAVLSTLIPNSVALNVDSKTNVAVYYVSNLFLQWFTISAFTNSHYRVKVPTSLV